MKPANFIEYAEDRCSGLMLRETAERIIREHKLKEVKLFYLNDYEEGSLSLNRSIIAEYPWSWDVALIRRELDKDNIPLIRENLRFFTTKTEPYPLIILKDGWPKAAVVAPMY